ncbi:RNA polymerase sigma factor [Bacteroides cellulosilyticus]|jgi:RNA polymerase sigma factor (sigma-70 family)|nr:sigma-70 family RNA polymerase sigma factor [Bacteroides cellulosilyticus]RGQ11660.1 sigma-70 family RNA polymerase sigma factor [Bacteroides cellulosilyticus]UVP52850.1 sigma-70 family RNA polymerase sigma factor [Bacteroides cellulosilyticus]
MMKKEEDFALWNQFLEGDEKAYLYIYKLYAQDMYSYGMLFTTNSELVKDCLHDVFIKIHRNRKKLSQVDNIRLYLLKAMKNYLFDVFDKKKELFHNDTIEPVFSPEYTIEDKIIRQEELHYQSRKIRQMLESLTPRQKEVLYYRYMKNLTYDEIGEIMQMNYQSILNLIQRSIKKLRETFAESKVYLSIIIQLILISFLIL